ncbi:hypothetical protein ACQ4LE_010090 [Meloidogyne hapla]
MSTKISFNKVSPSKNNCSIIKLNNNNNNLFYNNNLNNKSSSFPIDNIPPPLYEENKNNKEIVENKNKLNIDENGKLFRQKGLSFKITLLNFLKTLVGAGFLALPLAFRNAGLWSGLIMTLIFAFLNCLCMMQLVKCAQYFYRQSGFPFLSYGDLARQACSTSFHWIRPYKNLAKSVVDTTILFLEFGFCSTYYLFISITLKEFYEEFFHPSSSGTPFQWLMAIYVPMVLFNFLRTLKFIAWLSSIGNFCMVGSLAFLLQYVIRYPNHSIGEMPFFNTFDGLLTAAGSIIYSFEAQTLVLPMENKLKRPSQMLGPFGILSSGIFLASLVYSSIGFFGYVAYGDKIKGSITQNLPQHQISFTLVKMAICISVLASFLLQMYVIVEIVWTKCRKLLFEEQIENKISQNNDDYDFNKINENKEKESKNSCEYENDENENNQTRRWLPLLPEHFKLGTELLVRSLLVTVCFLFAAAVPNLERIIPLVGITSGMLLAFVYPTLIDLLTFLPQLLQSFGWKSLKVQLRILINLALASVGLFGMVAGLRANIIEILASQSTPSLTESSLNNTQIHTNISSFTS